MVRVDSRSVYSTTPRVHPQHELSVVLRHDLDILLHQERIVEHPSGLLGAVLDVSDLGVDAYLNPRKLTLRLGVRYGRTQIEHAADGYGVLEGAGIERDEIWAGVGEGRSTTEGELECLLQKKTAKDHKVVTVTVLRLHDHG